MSFVSDVKQWAENTGDDVDHVLRAVTLELAKDVIQSTPVDEGTARNGWFSGVNKNPGGRRAAKKTGQAALDQLGREVEKFHVGDKFTLINRIPYILKLEYGGSKQAPNGMLRRSIRRAKLVLRRKALETQGKISANRYKV